MSGIVLNLRERRHIRRHPRVPLEKRTPPGRLRKAIARRKAARKAQKASRRANRA